MNTTERKDRVLSGVVELYVKTGEPVGSKAVSAYLNDVCSAATIRNDMGDLIDRGFLIQPHTSAGRVPSAKGYRYYIDHLMPPYELSSWERAQIEQRLPVYRGDPDRFIAETGKATASLTRRALLITTPVDEGATLKRLELIPMSGQSVLAAILTSSGMMKSKVCKLDEPIAPRDLQRFSSILNERFHDLPLSRINPAMAQTLAVSLGAGTLQFAPLLELVFDAVQDSSRCELHVEGQANLLLYKEFSPVSVIELFARRESLLPFLQQTEESAVFVGSELQDTALSSACMIVSCYLPGGMLKGKIGLLGPLSTDYSRLIPLVKFIASTIGERMNRYL